MEYTMNDPSASILLAVLNLPKDQESNLSINGIEFRTTRELLVVTNLDPQSVHMMCWNHRHAMFQAADHLVVRYDERTEELSIVDDITRQNFLRAVPSMSTNNSILSFETLRKNGQNQSPYFPKLNSLLLQRYGISHGTKVVPGTYSDDDDDDIPLPTRMVVDGKELRYPAIPVFDANVRHASHFGTRQFLKQLSSAERTALFRSDHPNRTALTRILQKYYDDSWEMLTSDLEFSFVLLRSIHCYEAYIHWRDLTVLLLRAQHPILAPILKPQLAFMDEVFEHEDDAGTLRQALRAYRSSDPEWNTMLRKINVLTHSMEEENYDEASDDDEDGPVVVENVPEHLPPLATVDPELRRDYPILAAAIMETEDVLMTCARALDEAKDVSLVREAAAYLEQVEAHKT